MTFRTLIAGCVLLVAAPAWSDAGLRDGGDDTPDASVGNGGSEQMTQEGDEMMPNGPCSLSRDCERGFACVNGTCRYSGYRQATTGCSAALGLEGLALLGCAALARRRPRA